jgi:hypothetical protein
MPTKDKEEKEQESEICERSRRKESRVEAGGRNDPSLVCTYE